MSSLDDLSPRCYITPPVSGIFQVGVEWDTGRKSTVGYVDGKRFELRVPTPIWDMAVKTIYSGGKPLAEVLEEVTGALQAVQLEHHEKVEAQEK